MMPVLGMTLDHAQLRPDGRRRALVCSWLGRELVDPQATTGMAWTDPITGTLTIRPSCLETDWYTSNSGRYAKPSIASGYTVKTGSKWFEVEVFAGAGKYLRCDDTSGEYARTSSHPGLNRGMWLSAFVFSAGDVYKLLEAGWSNSSTPTAATADVGVELWSDGRVILYRAGTLVGEGKVSGAARVGKEENSTLDLIILPGRRRELTFLGSGGDGFSHVFEDIDESSTAPAIVPAATHFFVVPGPTSPTLQIQFAALQFATSAAAVSRVYQFGVPPKADQALVLDWINPVFGAITNASLYGDTAYAGSTNVTSVELLDESLAAFAPDGNRTGCRCRITLSGDGSYAPFVYGATLEYAGQFASTDDSESYDVTDWVMGYQLEVPDSALGVQMGAVLMGALDVSSDDGYDATELILADEVPEIGSQSFRPARVDVGGVTLMDGRASAPATLDAVRTELRRVSLAVLGLGDRLERFVFRDRVPMDGWPLCDGDGFSAVRYVINRAGIDQGQIKLGTIDYVIGEAPAPETDRWAVAIEPGDTAIAALTRLHRLQADCVFGEHPGLDGPEFWFYPPDQLPTSPVCSLYRSEESAQAEYEERYGLAGALEYMYSDWHETTLELEGNEIWAMGVDARTLDIVQAFAIDEASQDPTLTPSGRPLNWAGQPVPIGISSRMLKRQSDCSRAVEALIPLATALQSACQWRSGVLLNPETGLPVWRMDLVDVEGYGLRRVTSLSARFAKEVPSSRRGAGFAREAMYTAGTPRGRGGVTLSQIQAAQRLASARGAVRDMPFDTLIGARTRTARVG
jgi:hypothetical protein